MLDSIAMTIKMRFELVHQNPGHKKLKAFVTHAGLLSMFETAYHGVPVVMMPVFCDQDANAARSVADGYGIKIELSELSTDKLVRAVTSLIVNPQYKVAARCVLSIANQIFIHTECASVAVCNVLKPRLFIPSRRVQVLMKDQRTTPLDTGVYWTEYVLRHKGAYHLHTPARYLAWYQYYSYDVAAFFGAILMAAWSIYRRQKAYSIRIVKHKMQ